MKELDNQELSLHGTASRKLTSTRSQSTRNTSPEPSNSDQLLLLTEENSQSSTLSLSDSLAKICQLLGNEGKDFETVLRAITDVGYDGQWELLNTSRFLPQNRERVYFAGHIRGQRRPEIFPI